MQSISTISTAKIISKEKRKFLPDNLVIDNWEKLIPFFEDLKTRNIDSLSDLKNWIFDRSELEAVLAEDMGWRYIRMSCDTTNEEFDKAYNFFVTEIEPNTAPYFNDFNIKLINHPLCHQLTEQGYSIYIRGIRKQVEIYREENIPLITELQTLSQKYGTIAGDMTIEVDGKELTLQQAAKFLKDADRNKRKEVYKKITARRMVDKTELNDLYTQLIALRTKVAINADFANYRDYMFAAMGRFDYSVTDCFNFHDSISREITPLLDIFDAKRKNILGYEVLKPWDTDVDISGEKPLRPFETETQLIENTIACFNKVNPAFANFIEIMQNMGHLDLASRKGKAPGGYNYPLYEIGVPFIFMNAVGTLQDVVTMVHEGGHAIHSFLSRHLPVTEFKSVPSEVAELASMSMELISMEHWTGNFFTDEKELKRARRDQLEKVLRTLPWVATIDKFQHWVYENPEHTLEDRTNTWRQMMKEFGSQIVDWSGVEEAFDNTWQKQLHLFEVPFYYIEYGMAQLGAIAMWKNYKSNPQATLEAYQKCLSLGYTKSIPELYAAAGIKFDFSAEYVKELASFIKAELKQLE